MNLCECKTTTVILNCDLQTDEEVGLLSSTYK